MASETTNATVAALRARHQAEFAARLAQQRAEEAAVHLVTAAGAELEAARHRRAEKLVELDAAVASAARHHDVAVSVLALMLGDDEATASLTNGDVTAIRAARRRAPRDEVDARAAELRSAPGRGRRRRAGSARARQADRAEHPGRVNGVGGAAVVTSAIRDAAAGGSSPYGDVDGVG